MLGRVVIALVDRPPAGPVVGPPVHQVDDRRSMVRVAELRGRVDADEPIAVQAGAGLSDPGGRRPARRQHQDREGDAAGSVHRVAILRCGPAGPFQRPSRGSGGAGAGSAGGPSRKLKAWRAEPEIGRTPALTRSPTAWSRPGAAGPALGAGRPRLIAAGAGAEVVEVEHLAADPGGGGRGFAGEVERGLGRLGQRRAQRPGAAVDRRRRSPGAGAGRSRSRPAQSPSQASGERPRRPAAPARARTGAATRRPAIAGAAADRQRPEPVDRLGRGGAAGRGRRSPGGAPGSRAEAARQRGQAEAWASRARSEARRGHRRPGVEQVVPGLIEFATVHAAPSAHLRSRPS